MLQKRGYTQFRDAKSVSQGKDVVYLHPCLYAGNDTKVLFIDSVGNAECRETVKELKAEKLSHLIYVANNIPGRFHQDMDQFSLHQDRFGLRFELFEASFFLFDKMDTELMARCMPSPMTLEESSKWLKEQHLEAWQLLQYVPRDFVVRYFGLLPGQIVRVNTRPPKYRILLNRAHNCPTTV